MSFCTNFLSSNRRVRIKAPADMGFLNQLFKHRETGEPSSDGSVSADAGTATTIHHDNPFLHPQEHPARLQPPVIHAPRAQGLVMHTPDVPIVSSKMRLALGDVISRVPEQFVRPGNHDLGQVLEFDAQEMAGAMSRGRVEVPLPQIAKQCPGAFFISAHSANGVLVRLPLQKLVDQMGELAPVRHEPVPAPVEPEVVQPTPVVEPVAALPEPVVECAEPSPHRPEKVSEPAEPDGTATASPLRVAVRASVDAPLEATLPSRKLEGTIPMPEVSAAHVAATDGGIVVQPVIRRVPIAPPQVHSVLAVESTAHIALSILSPGNGSRSEILQALFMTDDAMDLGGIARHIAMLPSVLACRLSVGEQVALGGTMPDGFAAESLQGAAWESHEHEVSLFVRNTVTLGVLLGRRRFVPGVRDRLTHVVELLAAPNS